MKTPKVVAFTALALASQGAWAQTTVDTELLLLIDVSGSVSTSEYDLMMQGYENAFRNSSVLSAIESGNLGTIAVGLAFWSGNSQQALAVPFTEIGNSTQANAFADAIDNVSRPYNGSTAIASAISYGSGLFGTETGGSTDNAFNSTVQVIDVSGDGTDNDSPLNGLSSRDAAVRAARDSALSNGVDAINGLPIGTSSLVTYYQDNVIGQRSDSGLTAFTQQASTFNDFETALVKKLEREITDAGAVPEPSSALLAALGALGALTRRRR